MQEIIIHEQDEPEHSLRHDVRQPVQQHKGAPMVGAAVVQHVTVLKNEIQRVRAPDQDGQPQQSLHQPLLVLTGVGIVGMLQHAFANDVQSQQEERHRHSEALPCVAIVRVSGNKSDSNHEHISHQQRKCVPHIDSSNQSKIQQQQRGGDEPVQITQPPELFVGHGRHAVSLGHEEIEGGSNDGDGRRNQPVALALGPSIVRRISCRIAKQENQGADHEDGEDHPTRGCFTCRQCEHGASCVDCQS
mmetsp:Transcript_56036/g.122792  ORF Transcript_56036/g.122792 Transcript_56036/m.122792 type:complete len:246 (-) Transcript_56036:21-758(-)